MRKTCNGERSKGCGFSDVSVTLINHGDVAWKLFIFSVSYFLNRAYGIKVLARVRHGSLRNIEKFDNRLRIGYLNGFVVIIPVKVSWYGRSDGERYRDQCRDVGSIEAVSCRYLLVDHRPLLQYNICRRPVVVSQIKYPYC